MTPANREYAQALALAIEADLADSQEAKDWAARLVVDLTTPPDQLFDLLGAPRLDPLDVVSLLRHLSGTFDPERVFRQFLRRARDVLRARPEQLSTVTIALERLAQTPGLPDSLTSPCIGFDDQRSLAEQGIYGSVSDVRDDVVHFLEAESQPDAQIGA